MLYTKSKSFCESVTFFSLWSSFRIYIESNNNFTEFVSQNADKVCTDDID